MMQKISEKEAKRLIFRQKMMKIYDFLIGGPIAILLQAFAVLVQIIVERRLERMQKH